MHSIHFIFLMMCWVSCTGIQAQQDPAGQLPEKYQLYQMTERLDYTNENLFEYINGGAEMYLSYGLVGMKGGKYTADGLPDVSVEIYEMTEPKNAFGIYTQGRDKEEYTYGQGSQSQSDAVIFWKDRYFVIVNTIKATPQSQEAVKYLASLVDKAIPHDGKTPAIIQCLPEKGLAKAGYVYFHHYVWLNAYYFIADYNILNIDGQTDAVLAKYGPAQNRSYLLLIEYPNKDTAEKAYEQMKQKFAPEAKVDETIQLEDHTWFTVWKKGNRIGAIFNGSDRESTEQLYQDANHKM